MGAHSLFIPSIYASKTKRVDRSDDEEERDAENVKRKRKRIKQLESDSSDEEGKKICKQSGMKVRGLISKTLLSKSVGQRE